MIPQIATKQPAVKKKIVRMQCKVVHSANGGDALTKPDHVVLVNVIILMNLLFLLKLGILANLLL